MLVKGNVTLAIVKPDAIEKSNDIVKVIQDNNFVVLSKKRLRLTRAQAERFYEIHKERPFFEELVNFMISDDVVVIALEKKDAVKSYRTLIGDTDPAEAKLGTIRKMFGTSKGENAVHGSDSDENALVEIKFFFPESFMFDCYF